MKLRFVVAFVLVASAFALITQAQGYCAQVSDAQRKAHSEHWYELFLGETKVGFAHLEYGPSSDPSRPGFRVRQEVHLQAHSMGQDVDTVSVEEQFFRADSPYEFYFGRLTANNDTALEVRPDDKGYVATVLTAGQKRTLSLGPAKYTYDDTIISDAWVQGGPRVGDSLQVPFFFLSDLRFGVRTLRVVEREAASGNYTVVATDASTEQEERMVLSGRGVLLSATLGEGLRLVIASKEEARKRGEDTDIFMETVKPVNVKLGDPRLLENLRLEAYGRGTSALESGPWQEVERTDDGRVFLTLGSGTPAVVPTQSEIDAALAATVRYPVHDEKIVSLARRVTKQAKTPEQKVKALSRFVAAYIEDVLTPRDVSVWEILEGRKGDCSEHSLLFATLARAAGIPAREVTGLLYQPDATPLFIGHAWNEVALGGKWVAVDPVFGEAEANAAHIRFGLYPEGATRFVGTDLLFRLVDSKGREVELDDLEDWMNQLHVQDGSLSAARGRALLAAGSGKAAVEALRQAVDAQWGGLELKMDLARALDMAGWGRQAQDLASSIFWRAEDVGLRNSAGKLLEQLGKQEGPAWQGPVPSGRDEVVIVPLGAVDTRLVREFAALYAEGRNLLPAYAGALGLSGEQDRFGVDAFIESRYEASRAGMSDDDVMQTALDAGLGAAPRSYSDKKRFVEYVYSKRGRNDWGRRLDFNVLWSRLADNGQYNAKALASRVRAEVPGAKLVVAVTDVDLYIDGRAFVVGHAEPGVVVLSAHRLLVPYSGRSQDRMLVVRSLLARSQSLTRKALEEKSSGGRYIPSMRSEE